jgi:hypothetical protein
MIKNKTTDYSSHLRAIRTAISALAAAVLAGSIVVGSDYTAGFIWAVFAIVLILLSFVPTLLDT